VRTGVGQLGDHGPAARAWDHDAKTAMVGLMLPRGLDALDDAEETERSPRTTLEVLSQVRHLLARKRPPADPRRRPTAGRVGQTPAPANADGRGEPRARSGSWDR
jgi:hypothetical protein